jgi:enoyl-CoA hydratase/carnithine racemase
MSDEPELVCTREGRVLVARLNRPERSNALSINLLTLLAAVAVEAEASREISVLVLTGTGEKTFCAGMDLREFATATSADRPDESIMAAFNRLMNGRLAVPVVAAVNGTAVGGGLELLYGCDIIVAAESAKFGLPEVKRGLFAGGSGTLLGTRIPMAIALELALTGDTIDAARAYEVGLINQVVPADIVVASALDFARRIAANGPLGLAASKELIRLAAVDTDAATERASGWQQRVFSSEDAREGATAFIEKRAPVWKGR